MKTFMIPFALAALLISGQLCASEPAADPIDLFDAMKSGKVEARVVAKNALNARVTITNLTQETLPIQLPETFAAVHVFQFGGDDFGMGGGGGGGGRARGGGGGGGGGNQSTGGGLSGGGGMGGGGMGMMNLAAGKSFRKDVRTVCLEHGKKDPAKHLRYELRPLESVSDKPEVHILCNMVGQGSVDQQAAQAAVWHYNNGLSWEELANKRVKPRIDSNTTVPYFNKQQMIMAMNLGKMAEEKLAKEKEQSKKSASASAADQ